MPHPSPVGTESSLRLPRRRQAASRSSRHLGSCAVQACAEASRNKPPRTSSVTSTSRPCSRSRLIRSLSSCGFLLGGGSSSALRQTHSQAREGSSSPDVHESGKLSGNETPPSSRTTASDQSSCRLFRAKRTPAMISALGMRSRQPNPTVLPFGTQCAATRSSSACAQFSASNSGTHAAAGRPPPDAVLAL